MNTIGYTIPSSDKSELLNSIVNAVQLVMRYDSEVTHSEFNEGLKKREHFYSAVSSVFLQGGLVELNDLVLRNHDADVSIPHQDLTDAKEILDARCLIDTKKREWIFEENSSQLTSKQVNFEIDKTPANEFSKQMLDIDVILERTNKILQNPQTLEIRPGRLKQLLKPQNHDQQWDEWQNVIKITRDETPVLRSALLLDAWSILNPIPNKPWLGYEYANAALRIDLKLHHLPAITTGLRQISRNARKSDNRLKRLKAYIDAYALSTVDASRNYQKIMTRYKNMYALISDMRASSKIKTFIDYIINNPVITTPKAAMDLDISQMGILKMLKILRLREITGRSRYRVWSII